MGVLGCTFCIEGMSYYTKIYRNNQEKIKAELNYIGSIMQQVRNKGGRNDLWLVDSNFGMYNEDLETCKSIAECQTKYHWPEYIQCDTGKNNKPRVLNAARLVKGAMRLSGSVQTLDENVLKNIKRSNPDVDDRFVTARMGHALHANQGLSAGTLQQGFEHTNVAPEDALDARRESLEVVL